jgi:parallel beta-helix repeat protein
MGRVKERNLRVFKIIVFSAVLALIFTSSAVSADNLKVDSSAEWNSSSAGRNYITIQAAVNAANDEDTIFVYPGVYVENLKINKQVRIWSNSRNPGDTIIRAADPEKSTVEISGNRVSFSGFGIEGSEKVGILLTGAKNCFINNNKVHGEENGIIVSHSESNTISDNIATLNKKGIMLQSSDSNTIEDNIIAYNYNFGISIEGSKKNIICNNYFKNAENVEEEAVNAENIWQSPLLTRQNIVRGPYIGGNFWADLNGKGYSETSVDENNNGICDVAYNVTGGGVDKFPLYPKVPSAVKNLESKLNASAYEQDMAAKKNEKKAEIPVKPTEGTKESSETPGMGLGIAALSAGAACLLRRNK